LGEVLVVAPDRQWSGAGRAMIAGISGEITPVEQALNGETVTAYAVDAPPATAVILAILELAPRVPDLLVSGINFGENLSTEITISGTVGAALEAAAHGVPALAVSLTTPVAYHHHATGAGVDYATARAFTRRFARYLLNHALPYDADVLNVNVPAEATPTTPWRLTRLSRQRYYLPTRPDRENGDHRPGYRMMDDPTDTARNSDIYALHVQRQVSVTPLSLDLTARSDFGALEEQLQREVSALSSTGCDDGLAE
jgi:5'-nucleotidase